MNFSKKIKSPIGTIYLISNEHSLISLDIIATELFINAKLTNDHPILNLTNLQLDEYFSGQRFIFNLPIEPLGTPFQQKAWKALMKIPYGKIWSYGQQAKFLKSPKACRAVGSANGRNPIPIIIPCHRVIGSTGKLTGYSGGMKMKIGLLELEGHQIEGQQVISK
jgi:methylated-DNA-[protein]-cysteine S-methyltransferase